MRRRREDEGSRPWDRVLSSCRVDLDLDLEHVTRNARKIPEL
jgi:hypothetical protein